MPNFWDSPMYASQDVSEWNAIEGEKCMTPLKIHFQTFLPIADNVHA